jgi:hypothetical protein
MYSACIKLWRAFMHTVAVVIFIALLGAVLQTPVEIAAQYGYHWAQRITNYFLAPFNEATK